MYAPLIGQTGFLLELTSISSHIWSKTDDSSDSLLSSTVPAMADPFYLIFGITFFVALTPILVFNMFQKRNKFPVEGRVRELPPTIHHPPPRAQLLTTSQTV
ncbi:MAG: hypothetical protein INR71_04025, partial [Terriglobus roseus]|nr:hypothetical protein [Terriglobus roseus]